MERAFFSRAARLAAALAPATLLPAIESTAEDRVFVTTDASRGSIFRIYNILDVTEANRAFSENWDFGWRSLLVRRDFPEEPTTERPVSTPWISPVEFQGERQPEFYMPNGEDS